MKTLLFHHLRNGPQKEKIRSEGNKKNYYKGVEYYLPILSSRQIVQGYYYNLSFDFICIFNENKEQCDISYVNLEVFTRCYLNGLI